MDHKKAVIIQELKRVSQILKKDRFSRDEFIDNSQIPISVRDIEKNFGKFSNLMMEAGFRPQKHHKISNEELFEAYAKAYSILGHYPMGHPGEEELAKTTKISGGVFRKRFGGLKNFLFEYKNWLLEKDASNLQRDRTIEADSLELKGKVEEVVNSGKNNYFQNKQRYAGKAAENLVVAELLFRGFNAQILQVDEGIDVFATHSQKNELYLIQVKHSYLESAYKSRSISITVSSFEKNKRQNMYYIIVLEKENNQRNFLILPFIKIDEMLKDNTISKGEDAKHFTFKVLLNDEEQAFIGNTDLSRYLNAWDVLL